MIIDENNSQRTTMDSQTPINEQTELTNSNTNSNDTDYQMVSFERVVDSTSFDEEKSISQEEKGDPFEDNEVEEGSTRNKYIENQQDHQQQQQVGKEKEAEQVQEPEERKDDESIIASQMNILLPEKEKDKKPKKEVSSDEKLPKNADNTDATDSNNTTKSLVQPIHSNNSNHNQSINDTEYLDQTNQIKEDIAKQPHLLFPLSISEEDGTIREEADKNMKKRNNKPEVSRFHSRRFSPRMSCSIDFVRNTLEEDLCEDMDIENPVSPRSPVSLSTIPSSSTAIDCNSITSSKPLKNQPKISFNLINERGKELKIVTDVDRSSETMIIMDVKKVKRQSSVHTASPPLVKDKRNEESDKTQTTKIKRSFTSFGSIISDGSTNNKQDNEKELVVIIDERYHSEITDGSKNSSPNIHEEKLSVELNDQKNTEEINLASDYAPVRRQLYRHSLSGINRKEQEEAENNAYGQYDHFQEYNIYKLSDPEFYIDPNENENKNGIELSPTSSPKRVRESKNNLSFDAIVSQGQSETNEALSSPSHHHHSSYHQTVNKIQNFPLINHVVDYVAKKRGQKTYYRAGMSSQNYENDESEVARLYALNKYGDTLEEKEILRRTRIRSLARWTLLAIIGILIDIMYMFITIVSQGLLLLKELAVNQVESPLSKYFVYMGFSILYSSLAFSCVYFAPLCAGSGIPETKAFLNGIRIPYMHSMRTLIGKVAGTVFSVASGLPVGKYGPMIHIGSIIAANISKLARSTLAFGQFFDTLRAFSSHAEKRDLVVAGTAAGVTAAFNAPIGGLLLAWEESSSYWNLKVSWRVFFCTMTAVIFTFFVINSHEIDDSSSLRFLRITFLNTTLTDESLHVWTKNIDLLLFVGLGIAGGLLGALYVECHKVIAQIRDKMLKYGYFFQYLQVLIVTIIVISVGVFSAWGSQSWSCKALPNITEEMINGPTATSEMIEFYNFKHLLLRFTCPEGTYNEVASLVLNAGSDTLKLLYHMPSVNPLDENQLMFSFSALSLVALPYFFLLLLTFGIAIPSGFFVPQLVAGGLLGRMFITFLKLRGFGLAHSSLQVYALMGSAAFIGGVSRMLLSMTLMLVEATGTMQLLVPFAIILIVTRWVGNLFNQGIFETLIHMKGYPVLKADPPKWALRHGRAGDLATINLVTLYPIETSERLVEILTKTTHHLFPVVYPPGHKNEGLIYGTVMREVLIIILKTHSLSKSRDIDTSPENPNIVSPVICFTAQQKFEGQLSTEEMERPIFTLGMNARGHYADLRPYANRSLYLVNRSASLSKIYNLFRGVGLRHLLVVDEFNQNRLYGILTRHDLVPENIRKKYNLREKQKGKYKSPYWTLPPGIKNKIHMREANFRRSYIEQNNELIYETDESGTESESISLGQQSATSSNPLFRWWKRKERNQSSEILSSLEEGGSDNKTV